MHECGIKIKAPYGAFILLERISKVTYNQDVL